jgi:hypothetical protein
MKKLIVGVALLAFVVPVLLLAACGADEKQVPAGAIAAVGDGVVTQEQFDQIWTQAEAQYSHRKARRRSQKRARRSTTSSRPAS